MYKKEFQTIFDYAEGKVDEIEILLSANDSFSVKINEQNIESFDYADSNGISVRVIKDDKMGYSYAEKFDEKTLQMIVDEALENAKFTEDNEIAYMSNHDDVDNKPKLYSKELDKVDINDKITFAKNLEKISKETDKRVFNVPYAALGNGKTFVKISNNKGLNKEETQNYMYAYVASLCAQDDDKRMGMEFVIGRDFSKFNAAKLAKKSVQKSTELLGGIEIESSPYPVVFNNEMMATMLSTFSGIFNAKAVHEGRSLLIDKIGTKIANDKVTIIDDALHPDGFSSRSFDSEGFPSKRNILIENGKLKTYLHNTQTARKDNISSTGNASRGYKGTLGISPSNFYLKKGQNSEKELFKQHDKLVEIVSLQGMHSGANPISGDFSLSAEGFLYENGKRSTSLKQFTVSGNIIDLLKNIELIADNFRFNMSSIGAPSVLVSKLDLSG